MVNSQNILFVIGFGINFGDLVIGTLRCENFPSGAIFWKKYLYL